MAKRYRKQHKKHPARNDRKKVNQTVVHLNITLPEHRNPRFEMTREVYDQVMRTVGARKAEQGGAFGVNEDGLITTFFYDESARAGSAVYYPNVNAVQSRMRLWAENRVRLAGFVHSHPLGYARPSEGDRIYAEQILTAMPRTFNGVMYMPIVQTDPRHGLYYLRSYAAIRDDNGTRVVKADLFVDGCYYDEEEAVLSFMCRETYDPMVRTAVPTLTCGDLVVHLNAPHLPPEAQTDPACIAELLRCCAEQLESTSVRPSGNASVSA